MMPQKTQKDLSNGWGLFFIPHFAYNPQTSASKTFDVLFYIK